MLFTVDLISMGVKKLVESYSDDASTKSSVELNEDATKAEIESRILLSGAKVEQELAIARRIDSAEEVEIEEYYDTSGKGNVGLNTDGSTFSAGVSGEGRKVTKRIIKFKGCAPIIQDPKAEQ
ncbi:hypothetical protein [Vibrio coralliirubri]|uniref:hypothetical protein n=1 Tax=Vibrio coralliirubri TaxID=1516159 RepID=UPI000639743C|nr:hypothetical protein [Vibrio coralliirubri]CDT44197.1 conserved hypothetical protein [Vibrio coralliirubri]